MAVLKHRTWDLENFRGGHVRVPMQKKGLHRGMDLAIEARVATCAAHAVSRNFIENLTFLGL